MSNSTIDNIYDMNKRELIKELAIIFGEFEKINPEKFQEYLDVVRNIYKKQQNKNN
ncbi:hypothetical protein [Clostridioides sp. ZZV15-6598]|uniref:hypothetical protein n=1 Tax=Clostridioides sp. ZZV15-6598 TaxID=2811501 RepID=UPI001D10F9D2|nr:hypothetical protein [Clostridioides sp. ZZV15-6598]